MGEGTSKGYAWAQAHNILDVEYNKGNSTSFNEGCRMFARDALRAAYEAAVTAADFWRVGRGA